VSLTKTKLGKVNSPFSSSCNSSRSEEQEVSSQNLAEAGEEYAGPFCRITGVGIALFIPHVQFLFKCLGIGSLRY
jgi:hypothetical protein